MNNLSLDEELAMVRAARRGSADALQQLATHTLNARRYFARKYLGNRAELVDDASQEAWFGVERALRGFDAKRRLRFLTYAVPHMRNRVREFAFKVSSTVRRPAYVVRLAFSRGGEFDGKKDLSGVTKAVRQNVLGLRCGDLALNSQRPDDGEFSDNREIGDKFRDEKAVSPFEFAVRKDEFSAVRKAVEDGTFLTERERLVLRARFGFVNGAASTLGVIGSSLMVTRERVRQIEVIALRKLRRYLVRLGIKRSVNKRRRKSRRNRAGRLANVVKRVRRRVTKRMVAVQLELPFRRPKRTRGNGKYYFT